MIRIHPECACRNERVRVAVPGERNLGDIPKFNRGCMERGFHDINIVLTYFFLLGSNALVAEHLTVNT